jgi:very-short-patch-repair endonuclease
LWRELSNSKIGFKFRRQHSIKQFVIDLYCPEVRLAVEIDGEVHNFFEREKSDLKREKFLNELNIKMIRFSNYEIREDVDTVVKSIKKICLEIKLYKTTPSPSLKKEGGNK